VGARPLGLSLSITPLYLTKIPLFNTRAIVWLRRTFMKRRMQPGVPK